MDDNRLLVVLSARCLIPFSIWVKFEKYDQIGLVQQYTIPLFFEEMEANEAGVDVLDFANSVETSRGQPLISYLVVVKVDIVDLVDISGGLTDGESILFARFSSESLIWLRREPLCGDDEWLIAACGDVQDSLLCAAGLNHVLICLSDYAGVVGAVPILKCDNVCGLLLSSWLWVVLLAKTLCDPLIL